jgi:simple sugar transport system permease protein
LSEVLNWFTVALAPAYAAYTLAALGNAVIERSGVLNIAIDGFFVLSSALAYTYAILLSQTLGSGPLATYTAVVLTALTTAVLYSLFTTLNTVLPISQGAVGLSFMFAGYGLGAVVGNIGRLVFSVQRVRVDYLGVSGWGSAVAYVLLVVAAALTHLLLYGLRLGVLIRAVGEDPRAVSQVGVNVAYIRLLAGLVGGLAVGLGGAIFTLWRIGGWSQGQGLNHGWLAYAISVAGWRYPLLAALVSVFFSSLYVLLPHIQRLGLPVEISMATPYIASVAVMVLVSLVPRRGSVFAEPRALGREYFREERA